MEVFSGGKFPCSSREGVVEVQPDMEVGSIDHASDIQLRRRRRFDRAI